MKLLEVAYNLPRPMDCILDFKEVSYHWAHAFIVFGEDSLEDREVVLCHLVSNLIHNIDEFSVHWVFAHVKDRWLETFCHHIISIKNFLRKYDQN